MKELIEQAIDRYRRMGLVEKQGDQEYISRPAVTDPTEHLFEGAVRAGKKFSFLPAQLEDYRAKAIALGIPEHKVSEESGFASRLLEITASDETVNRYGDIDLVDGSWGKKKLGEGWLLENYVRNPVFMPFHNYDAIPLGWGIHTYKDNGGKPKRKRLRQVLLFDDGESNSVAPVINRAYRSALLRAFSVGFMPLAVYRPDGEEEYESFGLRPGGWIFTTNDLWETSAVSIPANPNALKEAVNRERIAEVRHLADQTFDVAPEFAYQLRSVVQERMHFDLGVERRGVVPKNISNETADKDQEWSKPALEDWTDKPWDELSDSEKRRIAGGYAWAESMPPENFGQLKLPHHNPSDGKINWRGLVAAAARFNQADIPEDDVSAVKAHLRAEYRRFDEEPPDVLKDSIESTQALDLARYEQATERFEKLLRALDATVTRLEEVIEGAAPRGPDPNQDSGPLIDKALALARKLRDMSQSMQ